MPPHWRPGLLLGYTAAGNNAGHDVVKEPGASFAWNNPNGSNPNFKQKVEDFGYRANVETNLLARKLIKAFYGVDASRAYWVGCSQGGREGMTLSQKFPELLGRICRRRTRTGCNMAQSEGFVELPVGPGIL